jgi:UDP-N-acetylmuramate dehydrogenase
MVLGAGTNVLFPDSGYDGVVVSVRKLNSLTVVNSEITADAGLMLKRVVARAIDLGLAGVEELLDVPGTVGGAVAGNAGAGTQAICDYVSGVRLVTEHGNLEWVAVESLHPAYRSVDLPKGSAIVTVRWVLSRSTAALLKHKASQVSQYRKATQPRGVPTAGCVFKNPQGESAGHLIDRAGLKGTRVGGAFVSPDHANFIVTNGSARAEDVKALIELTRDRVRQEFGLSLELELVVVEESRR